MEALTQEERDLLYALRDFADYRRDFIVDLVSEYYGVLLAREIVKNNYLAYQGFLKNVEREEAFAERKTGETRTSGGASHLAGRSMPGREPLDRRDPHLPQPSMTSSRFPWVCRWTAGWSSTRRSSRSSASMTRCFA